MKAISILQPWATLLVAGVKLHETRSWSTPHRGEIAIHASKSNEFAGGRGDVCRGPYFAQQIAKIGYSSAEELPRGAVLGVGRLVDCIPTADLDHRGRGTLDDLFGDFGPGRFAWRIEPIEIFAEPIPARGLLGLWEWTR